MTELVSLPGAWGAAYDINSSGQIVGECDYAFLWEGGSVTNLSDGWAGAVNDSGQIVGSFGLWENGTVTPLLDLLPPGSEWTALSARDINGSGEIVGRGTINGEQHAFLLSETPEPGMITFLILGGVALQRRSRRKTLSAH